MTNLMNSLRALPPKQALSLLLAEKIRRNRTRVALLPTTPDLEPGEDKPRPRSEHSLVLDRAHPLSDLYYKKARNKVYWGGRGSAKSWGIAEALVRLAAALPMRILCTREFQISIKDSSHRLLKDTITRLGLDTWFVITDTSIRCKSTGAEFIFKGLHNNENGIRSVEGIDIVWVEEAQTVTALSWQSLTPTMRKPGSEVWVSFNLIDENDATYKRFVAKPPIPGETRCEAVRSDSIVHKINYDSNPFFGDPLLSEMLDDKAADYELYEHIWLGMPRKRSKAIILNNKYREYDFADDLWKTADRLYYGGDFGFAQDPSTLSRMFILPAAVREAGARGDDLYISHEAYGTGIEFDEYEQFYGAIPGARDWPIKADCARPETISAIKRRGFAISGAEKWPGSVEDGITYLRSFNQILIHPRAKHHLREAFLWRYKVDPKIVDDQGQPQVLPVVVDKHNHTWDGVRYGHDGRIQRGGALGMWERLGKQQAGLK